MEAQLRFNITSQSLKRLDTFIGTEGSCGFLHASFDIEEDTNIPNPLLVVYARYDTETYIVPKNLETGLYDIPSEVIQYPGFSISCRIVSGDDDRIFRYTEECKIQIKGNGNILKRYMKADDQYSLEFLSTFYGQHVKNCENIASIYTSLSELNEQFIQFVDQVGKMGNIIQESFERLSNDLEFVKDITYPLPIEPIDPVVPEDPSDGENTDNPSDTPIEDNPGEVDTPNDNPNDNIGEGNNSEDSPVEDTPTEDIPSGDTNDNPIEDNPIEGGENIDEPNGGEGSVDNTIEENTEGKDDIGNENIEQGDNV